MTPEEFAVQAHDGAYRKGTNIPYIVHPKETAEIVATMTDDAEVIAAAWLHDVVEDTPYTVEDIRKLFGDRVAALVAQESENKREDIPAADTWELRKSETIEHLKDASIEIKMIALGDKLSNIRAMVKDYEAIGDKLWERFNQKDKAKHGWYYKSIGKCLAEISNYAAFKEYEKHLDTLFSGRQ